jgi:hypothetical protein
MGIQDVIPKAIGQITSFQNWIDQQANRFIVKPGTARGISGFVFSIQDEDRIELHSDITDYVMQDNTYINDHIALKPMVITLRGFVGELVNNVESGVPGLINTIQGRLTAVSSYLPERSTWVQQKISKAQTVLNSAGNFVTDIDNAIKRTQNLMETIGVTSPGKTAQEQAFSKIWSMFSSRQVFTVETPWGYFDNMAIISVALEQDSKTRQYSDITISMKQLQFATVLTAQLSAAGRAAEMIAPVIAKGKVSGEVLTGVPSLSVIPSGSQKKALTYIIQ